MKVQTCGTALIQEFCDRLSDPARPEIHERVLIFAAHPDDESIGIGAQLKRMPNGRVVHVTDGSPKNPGDALAAGFSNAQDYARARRREVKEALALAGMPEARMHQLQLRDQEAAIQLVSLAQTIAGLLEKLEPDLVITHPYEGGHPDHDATAFGVHAACALISNPPEIVEMTSYHLRNGTMATSEFLPCDESETVTLSLHFQEVRLKRRMFDCFATQRRVLDSFPIFAESFRPAPGYDFTRPPHEGRLLYEQFNFGMTEPRFRELAREAIAKLQIEST